MNPRLMKLLVTILLELSRIGQQIIIATHDYVLLKWFDLLTRTGDADHVSYFSLARDTTTGNVTLEKANDFPSLNRNSISNTFAELYDEDVKRALK
jgi:hypothetical protein